MELTTIQYIAVLALPLLFAITLHEVAHGWVASFFGDQTARHLGRLTLNPIKHIDPIGTVLLPLLMILVSATAGTPPFIFGWAKPVPVDARNFKHPRRDVALVSLAGPVSNLLMAVLWGLLAKFGVYVAAHGNAWLGMPLLYMGEAGISINVVLAALNLLPLPPLDGGKFLLAVLPPKVSYQVRQIEPYSFFILIALIFTNTLSPILMPIIVFFSGCINLLLNIV